MADLFITGYWYYYAQLPEHMKPIYMSIYNGLKARNTDFTFTVPRHNGVYPTPEQVLNIFLSVLHDNPAMYYVDGANALVYGPEALSNVVRITYTEHYTPQQCTQLERDLRTRMGPLLEHLRSKGDEYKQVYDLYRYMVAMIAYDYDLAGKDAKQNLEARTIVGPLTRRLAVCAGYTKMFKLLCDQLGIGCFYIRGTAKGIGGWRNHGWNVVYLKGNFYHIDVTFDSAAYHSTGEYTYNYYLRGDERMLQNHKWDRNKFPIMVNDFL